MSTSFGLDSKSLSALVELANNTRGCLRWRRQNHEHQCQPFKAALAILFKCRYNNFEDYYFLILGNRLNTATYTSHIHGLVSTQPSYYEHHQWFEWRLSVKSRLRITSVTYGA